jgi:hypothetical protein
MSRPVRERHLRGLVESPRASELVARWRFLSPIARTWHELAYFALFGSYACREMPRQLAEGVTCSRTSKEVVPMAGSRPLRERTVQFYEIVKAESGEQLRMAQADWDSLLGSLASAPLAKRTYEAESTFIGNTITVDEEYHLLLHRVKSPGEWLSIINWDTGEWHELEERAREDFLDSTVISFLPFGNVMGLMQGSTSAPTHKSVETWLNGLKFYPDSTLVVRPVVSRAEVQRLRSASGASRIEIRVGSSKLAALEDQSGRLASMLRRASEDYGNINVTLIISVPRGRARQEDRERLLEDLRDLEDVVPDVAERAQAALVYADPSGPEYTQLVELVEHHITAKRRVSALDPDGKSIRIMSAVHAIMAAADEHSAELRVAVDVG